ncbi:hypothetical protein FOZ62_029257, partial [Perkinsus olseni]
KIDSGLWQLLTTELLPSESLSASARVPGAMLSSLTRTPGCLARVAQCLGGASSQTVKGFACWVLSGSSSSLRPDSQLSNTIIGAAEGLILQQSKDLDPTINGLVAQLLLRFRKDGMRTLRSTPGECVAVDESLRSALHEHIVSRRARNAQDAEQQESYLSSLVTECEARRDAVNKAVVPAEMNDAFKTFDKYLAKYLQSIQGYDSSAAESELRPLPELDPGEVLAWATSALELQEVEREIADLNDRAEASEREAGRAKREAHSVEQQLKAVTADLQSLDARIISEGTAPGDERQRLAGTRSGLDSQLLQLKQVAASRRLEGNTLRQRAAELAAGRGAAAASSASGRAGQARGEAVVDEWAARVEVSKKSTRQVHKLSAHLRTVGLRLQQNEKAAQEELLASVRSLQGHLSRLEHCLAEHHHGGDDWK